MDPRPALLLTLTFPAVVAAQADSLGPLLGDLRPDGVRVWWRAPEAGSSTWSLHQGDDLVRNGAVVADAARDQTCQVFLDALSPATEYRFASGDLEASFTTRAPHDATDSARIAFASCASHDRFAEQPLWDHLGARRPDSLVLLGDTPYIDSTELETQRARYREFWRIPQLAALVARVPVYATWDDHDFALNDQVGAQPGRERSRQAFCEYHANPSYGDGERGIYTSFRSGPVEVFLVDTRWFGDEEEWPGVEGATSLLGKVQRQWLIERVAASTAEVKVLACGMVWNGAVRAGKRDCWGTWAHEREHLFEALGERHVRGIVLVGGDIHRPRVIRHLASKDALGYAPIELVSSPLANHGIAAANAPHPGLVWDKDSDSIAMVLEVERREGAPRVVARFVEGDGTDVYAYEFGAGDLGAR